MHLGASLAVIRYNEGFSGIKKLISELGMVADMNFLNLAFSMDKNRLARSIKVSDPSIKKGRYSIKQSKRSRKRIGEGYKSGAYSVGNVSNVVSEGDDVCKICSGSESSDILGKRKNIGSDVKWIGCDVCPGWFHVLCLKFKDIEVNLDDVEQGFPT